MGILAMGAGAAEGMDQVLARLMAEDKMRQTQQQIDESGRHNLATEGQASRALDINDAFRRDKNTSDAQARADALTERTRTDTNTAQAKKDELQKGIVAMRPIGSNVTPDEATADSSIGVSRGSYGDFSPGDATGQDFADGHVSKPTPAGMAWRGTQDQITRAAAEKDAASKEKRVPPGPIEETPDGMVRIGEDGKVVPVLGPDGKQLRKYHAPVQAPTTVFMGDSGPQIVDRNKGTARPVMGQDGKPIAAKSSAQETNRRDMASTVDAGADDTKTLLAEAEKRGLLGPLAGRTFVDFMAGKVGATGNPDDDELLGHLRMNMAALRSGFASLHGRGGANAGVAQQMEQNMDAGHMDYRMLNGSVDEMQKWIKRYAGKSGAASTSAPSGGGATERTYNPATGKLE